MYLHRADTCCAVLLRTKPTYIPTLTPNAGEENFDFFLDKSLVASIEERLQLLIESPDLVRDIIHIWLRIRYLSEFLSTVSQKNSAQIDDCLFTDKIDDIERTILCLLHSPSVSQCGSVAFVTAFLNASLIFIYDELRECPKWTNVCVALSERIYSGLDMIDLTLPQSCCPDMFLWILLLGRAGTSPLRKGGKMWFQRTITSVGKGLHYQIPSSLAGLGYFEISERSVMGIGTGGVSI